jgi:hypothetical protein
MRTFGMLSLVALFAFVGCHTGSSGGPGVTDSSKETSVVKPDESFTLGMSKVSIQQGETKTVAIPINRTLNFDEDVALSFTGLPKGITLGESHPVIKRSDTEARLPLIAAEDTALGDFSVKVTGHPTRGADAVNELKITVLPRTAHE